MITIILRVLFSFGAAFFFALYMKAPRRTPLFCGINGCIGYCIYSLLSVCGTIDMSAYFVAAMLLVPFGEMFARINKTPSTVFVSTAVLVLVPGIGLYRSMMLLISGNFTAGAAEGANTLLYIASMALGIAFGMMLVRLWFLLNIALHRRTNKNSGR